MKITLQLATCFAFVFIPQLIRSQVSDINGQTYKTVVIGSQTWMAENLNVDRFRNGELIPEAKTDEEWRLAGKNKQPAWCYYNNDPSNAQKYGKLYNWYAATDPRGIAPDGYKVPSQNDFQLLIESRSNNPYSGVFNSKTGWDSCVKDGHEENCTDCSDWSYRKRKKNVCEKCKNELIIKIPETVFDGSGKDLFGFNAMPSGCRIFNGEFGGDGNFACFITTEESYCESCNSIGEKGNFTAYFFGCANTNYSSDEWHFDWPDKPQGHAIRCIKN